MMDAAIIGLENTVKVCTLNSKYHFRICSTLQDKKLQMAIHMTVAGIDIYQRKQKKLHMIIHMLSLLR